MAKWTVLVASLKQKNYSDASNELDAIQDNDDLQDALQVVPFKSLNQNVPESLAILEKLYTKFVTLTSNKEEGRLIIRHVFKVDVLLGNLVRAQVNERVLHADAEEDTTLDMDSVDQIMQTTWSMDCGIVKELMSGLTRLKTAFKHIHKNTPRSLDLGMTCDEITTDLKCCLVKYNTVIQHLESFANGGALGDAEESSRGSSVSQSKVEGGSCRDSVEWIRRRCSLNEAVLDVVEPCKGNIERGPVLLQKLGELVQSDRKFLEIMTELSIDTHNSRYRDLELDKILRYFIISYKSVLSAVAAVDNESTPSDGQRSSSKVAAGDSGLLNHGLKIEVNGSPFRRRFDTKRLLSRDPRERREPARTHSNRELRSGDIVNDYLSDGKDDSKLKEKLSLREKQLEEMRSLVKNLKKREEQLLEKLTEQAKTNLMNSEKFENVSEDTLRVDHLIREYDDLYSQLRLEALDDLDNIKSFDDLERNDEIKSQITFAIITVSFHLTQQEIKNRREKIFLLLNMDDKSVQCGDNASLRNEISLQFGRLASKIDLQHVVDEVCDGLCSTMYDFPELKSCEQMHQFVKACVRFSWSICVHVPPLSMNYASTNFTSSLHSKSYSSDESSGTIRYHVWPALVESENGTVLYKGIVTT